MIKNLFESPTEPTPEDPLTLVKFSKQADIRQRAQESVEGEITDTIALDIIGETLFSDSRKWAVALIKEEATLKKAFKIVQGKDKNCARLIDAKLAELKQQHKQDVEDSRLLQHLLEAMQELSVAAYSPQHRGKYLWLVEQWQGLKFAISSENQQVFESSRVVAQQNVDNYQKIDQANLQQQQIQEQLQQLWSISQSANLQDVRQAFSTIKLLDIENEWQQSLQYHAPEDEKRELFHRQFQHLNLIDQWLKSIPVEAAQELQDRTDYVLLERLLNDQQLMKGMQSVAFIKELKEAYSRLSDTMKKQKQADDDLLKALDKQIGIAFHLKKQGNVKGLPHHIARIRKNIAALTQQSLMQKMQARLDRLESELSEIEDWTKFALLPKFERLCIEMENLIELTMPIPKRAEAIKKMQKQWKALGFMEGNDELWKRFKTAADLAYAPCAEYFSEERQLREKNTNELIALCEALELLLQHTEIKGAVLAEKVKLIDNSWRQQRDIDHRQIANVRERFKAARDAIEAHLAETYYGQIEKQRQEYIERITKIAEADISAHAEHQVSLLQQAWKQSEQLPKKLDVPLWTAFKAQLDIFYQKRRDQNQAKRQQANHPLDEAKAVINELKKLTKTANDEKAYIELQHRFNAIPDLEGGKGKDFKKQYQKLCKVFEKQHLESQHQSKAIEIDELKRRAELCSQLECGQLTSADVEAAWNLQDLTNNQWLQQINQRLERAVAGSNKKAESNPHRMLCLEVEIALSIETPSEDKALRMSMQMQLLKSKGLQGQKVTDKKAYLMEKQIEWLGMSITHPDEFASLQQRFEGYF